jgi:RAB protein geranylgeranyltransferase component A
MEEKYDVIILGTGLKECMLAGLLAKYGKILSLILQME